MQYTDGPNTHRYTDAGFVTEWTIFHLDDPDGVTHTFHVPTRLVEQARAETMRDIAHQAAQIGYTYGALGRDFTYAYKNVNDLLDQKGGKDDGKDL